MQVELSLTTKMSGTTHVFTFVGHTTTGQLWPDEMVQGGESYNLTWDDVPDHVREDVEDVVNLELVEE